MVVERVEVPGEALVDPDAAAWHQANGEPPTLIQTPVAMQPTEYIAMKWQDIPYGRTRRRADRPTHARGDTAAGIGTSRIVDETSISARGGYRDGRWSVVIEEIL